MRRIGITGSRRGLTISQDAALAGRLGPTGYTDLVIHGDCVGADTEAHDAAVARGARVRIYPPDNDAQRAFCDRRGGDVEVMPPAPYLARNQAIVDDLRAGGGILLAFPEHAENDPRARRSGTWATVRRARRAGVEVVVFGPDGGRL